MQEQLVDITHEPVIAFDVRERVLDWHLPKVGEPVEVGCNARASFDATARYRAT